MSQDDADSEERIHCKSVIALTDFLPISV